MATINSKKLLPQSKSSLAKTEKPFLVPVANILPKKGTRLLKPVEGDESYSLKNKLIQINKIISSTYLLEKSESVRKRKEREREKSEQNEKSLKTKKLSTNQVNLNDLKRLPGQSILDRIKRFIGFTILGYLFNNFGKYLPKLLELGKKLQPALKAFGDLSKVAFDGFVSLVGNGYKAYDFVNKTLKDFKSNNYQKLFDSVSNNLDNVLVTALAVAKQNYKLKVPPKSLGGAGAISGSLGGKTGAAAALAIRRTPAEILVEGAKKEIPKRAVSSVKPIATKALSVVGEEVSGVRMIYGQGGRGTGKAATDSLRNKKVQEGILRTIDKAKRPNIPKSLPVKPSPAAASSRLTKLGMFGKVASVPIIGGLIDYIVSTVFLKEKPSRAFASAIGTTIGTSFGLAISAALGLGTGGIGAALLGGAITAGASTLGSMIGTGLYDFANSFSSSKSYAQGGSVTRGGRRTGGAVARTVRRAPRTPQRIAPQKTQPGRDVGGIKKIEMLYGEDKPGQKSGLAVLKNTSNRLKGLRAPLGINALMGASVDLAMGQKPDKRLYQQIGNNFGATIANLIDAETNTSINNISKSLAMAGGGSVPSREIKRNGTIGERIGLMVSSYLRSSIESSAASILQEVKKQILMKGGQGAGPGPGPGDGAGPLVSSDSADFWLLSLISLYESSNPQGAADVAQSIYNRMGYSGRTARQEILARNQYQPVGQYGSVADWNKVVDKESALNHIKKFPGNAASAGGLEKVAAALLDKSTQQNAALFVGNRPDFRSNGYERQYDEMTDDTSRHGQTFGFNRGSAYKGKSFVAKPVPSLVRGSVTEKTGPVSGPITVVPGILDQLGRPVMFAKPAAEAFAAMMQDAKEQGRPFKGSDIASTYRTPQKNRDVGGATQSLHLKGLAADIHGETGNWIKRNGTNYGWHYAPYAGQTHEGHFQFVGGFKKNIKEPPEMFRIDSKNKMSPLFKISSNKYSGIGGYSDVTLISENYITQPILVG